MKKILCLNLILLITICIMGNVYATLSCEVSAQTSKDVFSKDEQVTVDFAISNIQSDRGIIAIGATLRYDKDSLTLEKMEGQNGWATPSYNDANGEMASTRRALTKENEIFLRVIFKVKGESKQNLPITLTNITVGDGITPVTVRAITKEITIKKGEQDTTPDSGTTIEPSTPAQGATQDEGTTSESGTTQNSNKKPTSNSGTAQNSSTKSTSISNTNKGDNTIKEGKLPKTGINNTILQLCIVSFVLCAVLIYIRIRVINKKVDK